MNTTTQSPQAGERTQLPTFKKVQAQVALDSAKGVVVRIRAMKNASSLDQFNALRSALVFDLSKLSLDTQTL